MCDTLWTTFQAKAFRRTPLEAVVAKAATRTQLKRVLGILDLVLLGVGSMVGSGVFVLTGEVAHELTGPAVVLSYTFAGVAALFAALVYAEFAADIPIAGASYNYVDIVFGEFVSWLAASSFLLELLLSTSAVAKGLSGYFATLVGLESDALVITLPHTEAIIIDIFGAAVTAFLTALLAYGVRESFTFNGVATALSLVVILITIGLAAPKFESQNFSPFLPEEFETANVFRAASIVFFSYIGFEGMATVAEEAKYPSRDIPISILTSIVICTLMYVVMAGALVGMIPYQKIDVMAAYSTAFEDLGWGWASRLVSFGALAGLMTSLFACLVNTGRLIMVLARERFIPQALASVHERTSTPLNATLLTGAISTVMTLLLDISTLSSMVSMGTLFVFNLVCMASIWRRYDQSLKNSTTAARNSVSGIAVRLGMLLVFGILEGLSVDRSWPLWIWALITGSYLGVVLTFLWLPVAFQSETFRLPFQPLLSALGLLCCLHLTVTLGTEAYIRFFVWILISVGLYIGYGMHQTQEDDSIYQPLTVETDIYHAPHTLEDASLAEN